MGSHLLNSGPLFKTAKAMAPGALQVQRAIGTGTGSWTPSKTAGQKSSSARQAAACRSAWSKLLWVGEEGHHQGVHHREPTQPLLFVATQRIREHQVQMLKKREDGLVVHHEAACLGASPFGG